MMMEINYIGEHLLPGFLGKTFIWLSFLSSIFSSVFFLVSFFRKKKMSSLHKAGRGMYMLHTLSLLAVALVLYYVIFMHYFEYSYVWQYSSRTLPLYYIFSCFWAGQEGSFLIWALAQAFIGVVLLYLAKDWEKPVMAVFSLSQVFVTSMLLGINILGVKIGGSPFILLRDTLSSTADTIFSQPNYLQMITDGNGLNPLLENIWMTIHPPVLFIGYALALVPFSYAMASFLRKDYSGWIRPAIPWILLSIAFLGAGILLGGAWAYVSLTFGGFWSWDPVENSSLVPWMTLVAGLHFILIARKQNFALFFAYLFLSLSYVLVLYASFLTRSGVLADTSAHSFGDNGMSFQLLVYLVTFILIMGFLIVFNFRKFHERKSDILFSREFWMFIGAIIIVLASFQIIFATSVPVFNKIFGTEIAPPSDRVGFYNRWQMPYALLIAGFIAFTQFLNYQENETRSFFRKILIPLISAFLLCILCAIFGLVTQINFLFFLFFILFALISSLANLFFKTAKPGNTGAVITHVGFLLFLSGTLLTFSNSKTISSNTSRFNLGDDKANAENLMLVRQDTLFMGGFYVTYVDNQQKGSLTKYQVDFLKMKNGRFFCEFSLFPSVNRNKKMGDVYNPSTRHFIDRDFYTYIAQVGQEPDYIIIKTIMNPYINLLWAGAILMIAGLIVAIRKRWIQKRSIIPGITDIP